MGRSRLVLAQLIRPASSQASLSEVEVALNSAQDFVIDDVFVAQLNDRAPFDSQRFLFEALKQGRCGTRLAIAAGIGGRVELPEAVIVTGTKTVQNFSRMFSLGFEFLQIGQRGFVRLDARGAFFEFR